MLGNTDGGGETVCGRVDHGDVRIREVRYVQGGAVRREGQGRRVGTVGENDIADDGVGGGVKSVHRWGPTEVGTIGDVAEGSIGADGHGLCGCLVRERDRRRDGIGSGVDDRDTRRVIRQRLGGVGIETVGADHDAREGLSLVPHDREDRRDGVGRAVDHRQVVTERVELAVGCHRHTHRGIDVLHHRLFGAVDDWSDAGRGRAPSAVPVVNRTVAEADE